MPYYAVKIGRMPGIYTYWPDAKKQVEGYTDPLTGQGPLYKRFETRPEALNFLTEPNAGRSNSFGPKKVDKAWVVVGPRKGQKSTKVYLLDREPESFEALDDAFLARPFSNYAVEREDVEELKGDAITDEEADRIKPLQRYQAPSENAEGVYERCLKAAADAKRLHFAKTIVFCHDRDAIRAWYSTLPKNLEEAKRAEFRNAKTGKPRCGSEHLKVLCANDFAKTTVDERASRHLDAKKLKRKLEEMEPDDSELIPVLAKLKGREPFELDPKLRPEGFAVLIKDPNFYESKAYKDWIEAETARFYDWLGVFDEETRRYFYEQVVQNSEDWHALRSYVMSATSAEVASSTSPFKSQEGFLQNKTWPDVKAHSSKAELANLERGSKNEDEARDACVDAVRTFYESEAAAAIARFVESFGRVAKDKQTESIEMSASVFVGGIYVSDDPNLIGMACSDDGMVDLNETVERRDGTKSNKKTKFSIECKVPKAGVYKKNGGVPLYYRDQMNFIGGMWSLLFALFSVLDLDGGVVRVRRFETSAERFAELLKHCKALHLRFIEGLILQRSGLLRYPETGPKDVMNRLQRDIDV